jgi:tripeptide aminopeptidase
MNRLLETFFTVVQIDSVTGEETKISEYLYHYLDGKVDILKKDERGTIYAKVNGEGNPFFFSAHMDTVEPGRGIKPRVEDGYVVTDGTTILGGDNKTALACIVEIVDILHESKMKHRPMEIIFTTSEEVGNYGAVGFDYNLLESTEGYCFDSGNPVGTVVIASPFYDRFDLKLIGKEAHASRPENAINVLGGFRKLLASVTFGKIDEISIFNFGVINGGSVRNTIPGTMTVNGEIRSFKDENILHHRKNFMGMLTEMKNGTDVDYEVTFERENPGYLYSKDDPFVLSTANVLSRNGFEPNLIESWGVSDANIFNDKGLKCVNLGHGGEFIHTTRERIKIEDMNRLLIVMKLLVSELS